MSLLVRGVIVWLFALDCVYAIANSFELSRYPTAIFEPGRVIIKPKSSIESPTLLFLPISIMASLITVLFECKAVTRPLNIASPLTMSLS